jgi:oxygen-independent coproporphyrinogen III oxidase
VPGLPIQELAMDFRDAQSGLIERYDRAVRSPRLMMLYPPVSTGHPYQGNPNAGGLWDSSPNEGSLYVHVPFCEQRCAFCPFYAVVGKDEDYPDYIETVLAEAALYARAAEHVRFTSVYLGGGTPSVLPPALVERLLRGLGNDLRLEGADVSLEANPTHVDRTRLRDLLAAGVTRLSLGVQSFDAHVLDASDRGYTAASVMPAVEAAMAAPLRDLNVDLMYGLPDQTLESWLDDLRLASRLGIPGITLYATVYVPSFQSRCESENRQMAGPQDRLEMYELAYDLLSTTGYPQPHFGAGAFLRHGLNPHRANLSLGNPTLGLGAWAYSSSGAYAWQNETPPQAWAQAVRAGRLPVRQLLAIPERERMRKHVIEALLLAYVDLDHFRTTFGQDLQEAFPAELATLDALGLATVDDGELCLTRQGGHHLREIRYLFASDSVVASLEADETVGL